MYACVAVCVWIGRAVSLRHRPLTGNLVFVHVCVLVCGWTGVLHARRIQEAHTHTHSHKHTHTTITTNNRPPRRPGRLPAPLLLRAAPHPALFLARSRRALGCQRLEVREQKWLIVDCACTGDGERRGDGIVRTMVSHSSLHTRTHSGAATATADAMARMGQQGAETAMSNVDLPFVPSSLIHQVGTLP